MIKQGVGVKKEILKDCKWGWKTKFPQALVHFGLFGATLPLLNYGREGSAYPHQTICFSIPPCSERFVVIYLQNS
jgi:hypothetical protein